MLDLPSDVAMAKTVVKTKYGRRSGPSPSAARVEKEERVTEQNFAQKLYQALEPLSMAREGEAEVEEREEDEKDGGLEAEKHKRRCVRNVHELLESGSNSRLFDELQYVSDGLESLPHDNSKDTLRKRHEYLKSLSNTLFGGNSSLSSIDMSHMRDSGILDRIVQCLIVVMEEDDLATRFLATLYLRVCGNLRRIDFFIPFEQGIRLVERLLSSHGQKDNSTERSLASIGFEMLVKLIGGHPHDNYPISQSNQARSIAECPSIIKICWQELTGQIDDENWMVKYQALDVLRFCALRQSLTVSIEQTLLLLKIVLDLLRQGNKRQQLIPAILDTLIAVTAVEEQVRAISTCSALLQQAIHLCLQAMCHTDEIIIASASLLANLVDRNTDARVQARNDAELLQRLAQRVDMGMKIEEENGKGMGYMNNSNSDPNHDQDSNRNQDPSQSREPSKSSQSNDVVAAYCGVLLGILLYDDEEVRLQMLSTRIGLDQKIHDCFEYIMRGLKRRGRLSTELIMQLGKFSSVFDP